MFKVIVTKVVISHGYNNAPALKFSDNGGSVRFRIGKKVYDPNAENKTRWINMSVKAFGNVCERIKKMQLKESSFINLEGRLDEEVWTDNNSNEQKSQFVIVLDDIEYASAGDGSKSKEDQNQDTSAQPTTVPQGDPVSPTAPANAAAGSGFTGYEPFGAGAGFFDEG